MTIHVSGFWSFHDYINLSPIYPTRGSLLLIIIYMYILLSHLSVLSRGRRADPNFNGLSRGVRLGRWLSSRIYYSSASIGSSVYHIILFYNSLYYYYYYYYCILYMRDRRTFSESLMRLLRRRHYYPFVFNVDQLLTLRTNNDVCTQTLLRYRGSRNRVPREVDIASTVCGTSDHRCRLRFHYVLYLYLLPITLMIDRSSTTQRMIIIA